MLWIYAGIDLTSSVKLALEELPTGFIDLSKVTVEDLPKAVKDFCDHHLTGHIYLGFLDPLLMLHPTAEAQMRRGFEKCDMTIVVSNPLILPLSWKNGTRRLRIIETVPRNANNTKIIHDGCPSHIQPEIEYGRAITQIADKRDTDQSGKEGSAPKRRKQKRQDQTTKS